MAAETHEVEQFSTGLSGIEAVCLRSTRHFPRHSHDQFGIGTMTAGGHNSWSHLGGVFACKGDMIMVNPGEMHDGSPSDGKPRSWKMLYLEPPVLAKAITDDGKVSFSTLKPAVRDEVQAAQFARLFTAMIDPRSERLEREERLLMTLSYAFRQHGASQPARVEALANVRKVIARIDSAPQAAFSLQELAQMAGTSRFQLLRSFSHATGATPHAYILQQRVRLARRLLAAGSCPVQASIEAGFADQSHMTRAFVRQLGVTPARYRAVVCTNRFSAISFKT